MIGCCRLEDTLLFKPCIGDNMYIPANGFSEVLGFANYKGVFFIISKLNLVSYTVLVTSVFLEGL